MLQRLVFLLLGGMFLLQLCACSTSSHAQSEPALSESDIFTDIPTEYVDCLEQFLESMKVSTEESAKYAYFPSETIEQAHKDSSVLVTSYSVEAAEKVNDNLYAFKLILEDTYTPGEPYEQWKFVGKIDGKLKVIGNIDYVPEELEENLDRDKYAFQNEDILPQDSIIFDLTA